MLRHVEEWSSDVWECLLSWVGKGIGLWRLMMGKMLSSWSRFILSLCLVEQV